MKSSFIPNEGRAQLASKESSLCVGTSACGGATPAASLDKSASCAASKPGSMAPGATTSKEAAPSAAVGGGDNALVNLASSKKYRRTFPKQNKKTIGVIGGSGPDAGVQIVQSALKIHKERNIATYKNDKDAPNIVLMQHSGVGGPHGYWDMGDTESLDYLDLWEEMTKTILRLEAIGAACFCITCNTLHALEPALRDWMREKQLKIEFVSIIDSTQNAILKKEKEAADEKATSFALGALEHFMDAGLSKSGKADSNVVRIGMLGSYFTTGVHEDSPYRNLTQGRENELEFATIEKDERNRLQDLINETKRVGPLPELQDAFFNFVVENFLEDTLATIPEDKEVNIECDEIEVAKPDELACEYGEEGAVPHARHSLSMAEQNENLVNPILVNNKKARMEYLVLGCTELPLLLAEDKRELLEETFNVTVIDPNFTLAETLLTRCDYLEPEKRADARKRCPSGMAAVRRASTEEMGGVADAALRKGAKPVALEALAETETQTVLTGYKPLIDNISQWIPSSRKEPEAANPYPSSAAASLSGFGAFAAASGGATEGDAMVRGSNLCSSLAAFAPFMGGAKEATPERPAGAAGSKESTPAATLGRIHSGHNLFGGSFGVSAQKESAANAVPLLGPSDSSNFENALTARMFSGTAAGNAASSGTIGEAFDAREAAAAAAVPDEPPSGTSPPRSGEGHKRGEAPAETAEVEKPQQPSLSKSFMQNFYGLKKQNSACQGSAPGSTADLQSTNCGGKSLQSNSGWSVTSVNSDCENVSVSHRGAGEASEEQLRKRLKELCGDDEEGEEDFGAQEVGWEGEEDELDDEQHEELIQLNDKIIHGQFAGAKEPVRAGQAVVQKVKLPKDSLEARMRSKAQV